MGLKHCNQNGTTRMAVLENGGRDATDFGGDHIEHMNPDHTAGSENPDHTAGSENPDHTAGSENPDHTAGSENPDHTAGSDNHGNTTGAEDKLLGDDNLQIESHSSPGCKRLALILSLASLLTCLYVLLYVTVVLATQVIHGEHQKHAMMSGGDQVTYQEVCLDCQRLVKNPYSQLRNDPVVEALTQRKEGNVLKCCAENSVQLSAMLKAVARRQDTIKDVSPAAFAEMQKSSTVSVHKQMISERWNSLTGYSVVKFDPSNNDGLGEQSRGATILEDGIVILKTGTYYIYSNVFFNGNDKEKTSNQVEFSYYSQGISFKCFSVMSAWYILTGCPPIWAWSCSVDNVLYISDENRNVAMFVRMEHIRRFVH